MTNTRVGSGNGRVAMQVSIDGRPRTIMIEPEAAIQIANQIATEAVRLLSRGATADMGVDTILLHPFDARGQAHLMLGTEHGPFTFRLGAKALQSLAAAAEGALEHGDVGGQV
ncbi:hypothetical protein [uncultured Sphingomonas sp.]|uniref:hypothetical protein n=1 Tax=uncultured Sphingomonas sp. TaxID=158754 RepID=UPI0025CC6782|nr:hypothetical protein [uncultured Sphingomonas sp.]